jgi:hypothetical protein
MFEVYECDTWDCGVVETFETLEEAQAYVDAQETSSDCWYEIWQDGEPMD